LELLCEFHCKRCRFWRRLCAPIGCRPVERIGQLVDVDVIDVALGRVRP
jgi:hypothetical protein